MTLGVTILVVLALTWVYTPGLSVGIVGWIVGWVPCALTVVQKPDPNPGPDPDPSTLTLTVALKS